MNQTLHMGLWTVYYDENAEGQVVWSDEFRKMNGSLIRVQRGKFSVFSIPHGV